MEKAHAAPRAYGAFSRNITALGAAGWLCLAATPVFALMALLTGVFGTGQMPMVCSPSPDAPALTGMVLMYLLMSVFHAPPWLKLIASCR